MNIEQVTVFGGGFIGRAIVQALARQGHQIRVAVRRPELAEQITTAGSVGQVMLMRANIRMPRSVAAAVAGSQAVVNATGIPFQRGRQRYQAVHVEGAENIASACQAAGVERLVHVSGIGAERDSKNAFIRSKGQGEQAVIAAFATATFLRPSVVFGPDDQIFNRMAGIAARAPFLPVIGDGSVRVQPVFVGDVGAAAAAVLANPETAKSVFELGGPRVYTYRELAELVLRTIDRRRPIIGVPVGVMKIAGFFAQQIALLGLRPPLTADQVELMRHDNLVRPGALTLGTLGIRPTAAEAILPTYLDRFRIGGRYNQHAPA
ncbi:complex I NDUFA9 subunit family protein [Enhydrobacter sp.]|jgi:NADH dehydrogenase|uniref:complex I NDUFA9 subunit family protein n=1 Tax=Enhydrobacter sp. TaxID=1894999 RepID=UPI002613B645|nr:complex I NDUFA9 subunit family protein [Enhydrobacter sp.]WIM10876.1 MAG: NAD-dependent epimerase/dehydratase [Enhydrobacter sp.]